VQEKQPTKAEMKKRLLEIRDAALLLRRALSDAPMREFLETEGSIRIENIGGLDHTLRMIAERAERAAASPTITTTAGETKKGRGKALPLEAISPKGLLRAHNCRNLGIHTGRPARAAKSRGRRGRARILAGIRRYDTKLGVRPPHPLELSFQGSEVASWREVAKGGSTPLR
jgi:hypothetical protein